MSTVGQLSRYAFTISLLALACESEPGAPDNLGTLQNAIIYGEDDRTAVAAHLDKRAAIWSDSVAILADSTSICPFAESRANCELALTPMQTVVLTDPSIDPASGPLCSDQRFADQSRVADGTCTAFYVGSNRFITAAHCIEEADCGDPDVSKAVLFGFTADAQGNTPATIPREGNFYRCTRIVQRELQVFDPGRIDYAVFEVAPDVTGHRPLLLRRSGAISAGPPAESTPATPLGVIGHGLGLPMMASLNGQARNNTNTTHFYHTIDAFPGDSGSPVLSLDSGLVEGVHAAGPVPQVGVPPQRNFRERNAGTPSRCLEYASCAENACPANEVNRQWSQATRITRAQLLSSVPEVAGAPDENVIIVLDQTGSMTEPGLAPGSTKWDDAINAAMGWVAFDAVTAPFLQRAYSVWTFRRGEGQQGLVKIWPTPESTNCSRSDEETGFCVFDRVVLPEPATDYLNLEAELESMRATHRPVTGPTTPLSQSLCEALELLRPFAPLQRIILESDGGENASTLGHPCAGSNSAPFVNPLENTAQLALPDWGMTLDSWQAKVLRRATRLEQAIQNATAAPLTPTDGFPVGLVWNVDVHYTLLPAPEQRLLSMRAANSGSASEWEQSSAATVAPVTFHFA